MTSSASLILSNAADCGISGVPHHLHPALHWFRITLGLLVCTIALHGKDAVWLRIKTAEFTVLTSLPPKEATVWAGDFAQFVAALQGFIPLDATRLPRLTMVVFDREKDFARYRPLGSDGKAQDVAGFFSRRESWAVAGLADHAWEDQTSTTIFHEGTHWFLSAFELPNPVWLEEGLAEVFSTFQINKKGKFSWGRAISEHAVLLNQVPLMPMEKLLFLPRSDLFGSGGEGQFRTGLAYAQSWALVHFLIFGKNDLPPGALMNYVRALRTSVHPDQAFQQAFGGDYATLQQKLRAYLKNGRYYVAEKPIAPLPPLIPEPANAFEVEDALARLSLTGRRYAQALEHANRSLTLSENNPVALGLLGEIYHEKGDPGAATAAFESAIQNKSRDFRPYFERARAGQQAAVQFDGSLGNLSSADARRIANDYERAINLNPRFLPAYQSLAGVVELAEGRNDQDAPFIQQGLRLFPDDGMVQIGAAVIARRSGNKPTAQTLLARVLDPEKLHSREVRAYANRLENAWLAQDVFAPLNELAAAQKFDEALAMIDQQLGSGHASALQQQLRQMQRGLQHAHRAAAIQIVWEARQWKVARQMMNEFLDTDAPHPLKAQMRRRLQDLDLMEAARLNR